MILLLKEVVMAVDYTIETLQNPVRFRVTRTEYVDEGNTHTVTMVIYNKLHHARELLNLLDSLVLGEYDPGE